MIRVADKVVFFFNYTKKKFFLFSEKWHSQMLGITFAKYPWEGGGTTPKPNFFGRDFFGLSIKIPPVRIKEK